MKNKVDVILVSDIHLGASHCHAKELQNMLESYVFKKLILVGDVFQHGNFDRLHKIDRLDKTQWNVLSMLRKLTDPEMDVEVIWIEGNHDWKVLNIIGAMLGIPIFDEYVWQSNGKKFLAIHGHQFDLLLPKNELINKAGQNINLFMQKHFHKKFTRLISKIGKKFSRSIEFVRNGAISYANDKHCDYVFCGHTHFPESITKVMNDKKITYLNCGTWADGAKLSYITITNDEVYLHDYPYLKIARG
ncbi:MAG: UDP-2,3-diacylglucosamine diphosphatase [Spirochaetia bacterium]|nr:UDP-2,3-diacylglucosamine diphosphatase [Spirochaetia bacterium]